MERELERGGGGGGGRELGDDERQRVDLCLVGAVSSSAGRKQQSQETSEDAFGM